MTQDDLPPPVRALFEAEDFPSPWIPAGSRVVCCFCGEGVDPGHVDPVSLRLTPRADRRRTERIGNQVLYCHATCLEAAGCKHLEVTNADFWTSLDAESDD